jgi:nitric oxide reductase large subunit
MPSAPRLALAVLIAGVIGTTASLFGPGEPWLGMDVGAVGSALFWIALVAAITLFATAKDRAFPEDMSIEERRAWLGIVILGVVLASFTRELLGLEGRQVPAERLVDFFSHGFFRKMVTLFIVWGVIAYAVGSAERGVESDERDLRLRRRADRAGDWALTLIVIACAIVLASAARLRLDWWLQPLVLAHVLIGVLIVKAFVEHVALAYSYRFGRA